MTLSTLRQALATALKDDGRLSHEEVIDLIRSTLDQGKVTADERAALSLIMTRSKTITPRSKMLLNNLLTEMNRSIGAGAANFLVSEKAGDLVCGFLKRSGPARFPALDRDEVGLGLLMRLSKPAMIDQGASSLCGPSSLLFNLATDRPVDYVTFGIDLYEKGWGRIGKLKIEPGADCRAHRPPGKDIHPVDWMMTASIRDSENWFFDYESVANEFAGITMPGALADWFEAAGYSDVRNETNVYFTKGRVALGEVNQLVSMNYRVCLFIGANMLYPGKQGQGTTTPDHWVVLRTKIDRTGGNVRLKVFTWGEGEYSVPKTGTLSESDFLKNFYGFVAAKP